MQPGVDDEMQVDANIRNPQINDNNVHNNICGIPSIQAAHVSESPLSASTSCLPHSHLSGSFLNLSLT
jgi:hypothetical protein